MNISWILPEAKGIPVLMYHKVWPGQPDNLTIDPIYLKEQWDLLANLGYRAISLQEYLQLTTSHYNNTESKYLLITVDDGYVNNYNYIYPLLQKLGWCATFFIIAEHITNKSPSATPSPEEKMNASMLSSMDPASVQLALHGYSHEHFADLTIPDMRAVMERSMDQFELAGLPYHKVLAYPYGERPNSKEGKKQMKEMFSEIGLQAAFRIGNRITAFPANDRYEINRIDIKGTDRLEIVLQKIKKGKIHLF